MKCDALCVTVTCFISQVHFCYPSRPSSEVLRGVSLTVAPGKVTAVVGFSGSGKSTLMCLLQRFYDVDVGCISLDGHDIRGLDPSWLRTVIAAVLQEPVLFATSIRENLMYGVCEHQSTPTDSQLWAACDNANASNFIRELHEGLDCAVGERGVKLSGGQKQRIAIARAMLRNPKILLLDEATSALDAESEHLVQTALERLMTSRTTLLVAHRLSTVQKADCIACMHDGRIVEVGTHAELLEIEGGHYSALVARQLGQLTS